MEDEKALLAHMDDLACKAQKTGAAHSRFLTPAQQAAVEEAFARRTDVTLCWQGGFAAAERQVAILTQPDWGVCEAEDVLAGLRVDYRQVDVLRHQDILGAVLALGVERAMLGDIVVQPGTAYLACLAPMAPYILAGLEKAGRVGLRRQAVPLAQLPSAAPPLHQAQCTVASLRLDAVVAAAFGASRSAAAAAIRAGQVQLAHRPCTDTARLVAPGQILSLRGRGRVVLLAVGGTTRKGRYSITLGRYG